MSQHHHQEQERQTPPPSTGKTRGRHRMRCSRCLTRFTLKRHPDHYVRRVRCPACRATTVYSCEASRRRELAKQDTCRCHMYPFPHRAGTLMFCTQNPGWQQGLSPTDQDFDNYQRVLETPRSGAC